MGNTRDTGYLQNLVTYDASGNIVLPANLTVNGNLLVATQSYVTTQISNLINGAPALLDTLDELAAALGDDASFASTITTSIAGKQAQLNGTGFVKVTGTTISYDNSTYLTTSSATSTYLPLAGGTLTGPLNGTSAVFSSSVTAVSGLINGATDAFFDINRSASGNAGRVRFQTAGTDEFEIGLKGGVAGFHITKGDATELVTVLTSGNVGIGTTPTNPGKKLEISDENNSTSTTTGLKIINWSLTTNARAGIVFQSYDNNGAAIWSNRTGTTTGELMFGTNNSASTAETNIAERMRIYSDGVVTTRIIQLNDPTYFASNYYGIRLAGVDNGVNGTNFQIQGRTTPTGGFSTLFTITNGGAASFNGTAVFSNAISPNGGVYALGDVLTSSGRLLASNGSQGANTETASILLGNRGYFTTSDIGAARISAVAIGANWYSGTGLAFYTNPGPDVTSTGAEERMRISSNGNVGISTTSPTTRLDIGNGTLTLPTLRGRTYTLSNVSSSNPNFVNGTGFNSIPVRVGDYIDLPFGQTRIVTAVTDTQLTVNSAWSVSFGGSNVEGRGGIIFQTNNADRMHITSDNSVLIPGNIQFASILPTSFTISLSGISSGSWFNIPAFNFSGFSGLVTIQIQNLNADHGYFVLAAAWIVQQGHNGDNSYAGIRGVTIRPDGVSYEGYDVIESYHTAPVSGRYNMRMRLRVRDAGLAAANPINLQIWVDHTVGITNGTTTLAIKRI